MPPVSPENAALQHAIAEATARLRAQIRQDIAALRQAVNESGHLVQDVQRQRAAVLRNRVVGTVHAPMLRDKQAADEESIAPHITAPLASAGGVR